MIFKINLVFYLMQNRMIKRKYQNKKLKSLILHLLCCRSTSPDIKYNYLSFECQFEFWKECNVISDIAVSVTRFHIHFLIHFEYISI